MNCFVIREWGKHSPNFEKTDKFDCLKNTIIWKKQTKKRDGKLREIICNIYVTTAVSPSYIKII